MHTIGSSPCELTFILSGATSSAAKSMWNQWIVWPVYSIVLFIDLTSQRCWKTVLRSSKNVFFIIYIKPITFFYYVLWVTHADNLHLYKNKNNNIYCILWRKAQFKPNTQKQLKFFQHGASFIMYTMILHVLIWHKHNSLVTKAWMADA